MVFTCHLGGTYARELSQAGRLAEARTRTRCCGVDADARCVGVGGGVRGRTSPGGVRAVREQPRGRRRRVLVVLISFSSRSHLVLISSFSSRRRVLVVLFAFSSRRSHLVVVFSRRRVLLVLFSFSSGIDEGIERHSVLYTCLYLRKNSTKHAS